jgi:hypothetical protein
MCYNSHTARADARRVGYSTANSQEVNDMERAYRLLGCLTGLLVVGLACADSQHHAHTPLFVSKLPLPSWAPLWEWEQPRDLAFQHRVVEYVTGVQGVGACCAEGVTHDGYRLHLCFAPGTPEWYVDYISRLVFGDFPARL